MNIFFIYVFLVIRITSFYESPQPSDKPCKTVVLILGVVTSDNCLDFSGLCLLIWHRTPGHSGTWTVSQVHGQFTQHAESPAAK